MNIKKELPSDKDFNTLINSVGWGNRSKEVLARMRKATCYAISIYENDKIVGMGRVVGDGYFYTIFDVVTLQEYQGKGIGTLIMENILQWFNVLPDNPTLYLGASKGKENYYEKFGFRSRPNDDVGAGMKYYKLIP